MSKNNPEKIITADQVAQHNTRESCWIIVHGRVYDVTEFLPDHPGGMRIILKYAGQDATEEYDPIHPPDAIVDNLPPSKHLGRLDEGSVESIKQEQRIPTEEEREMAHRHSTKPALSECISLHDLETVARHVMPSKAWMYYSSGADDEITLRANHSAYHRIWFRPRVMRDVSRVHFSTSLLGQKSSMPLYVTATALGKLGHPMGELNLTRSAAKHGVIQMIPTLASCSFDEIRSAALENQTQWLQLYVNRNRDITEKIVRRAESSGVKGLFVTVDAPQLGRREKDMRMKFDDVGTDEQKESGEKIDRSQGAARAISSFIDPSLNWNDMGWLKSITNMPIVLKGVQCWQDAVLAAQHGCAGVVLSNHGGRQLDFAPSGVEILPEVMSALRDHGVSTDKFQVFVDGGVRRASDIIKAVALGAKAVGIGRPFIYAYSAYGEEGVDRAMEILRDEFEMCLRLLGARSLDEVTPEMVNCSNLGSADIPKDYLFTGNYERLSGLNDKMSKL